MDSELECVNEADQTNLYFLCIICHGVMQNSFLVTCCQNSFCESCIKEYRRRNSQCPICKQKKFDLVLNRGLRDLINSQLVYCYHKSKGCSWNGKRENVERHLKKSCDFHKIKCEHGCGQEYLRKEMKSHFSSNFSCIVSMDKRLKELTQTSENRIKELENSGRVQVQALERQKQQLMREKQELEREKRVLEREKQRLERELKIATDEKDVAAGFCIVFVAVSLIVFGHMYYHYNACPPAKPEPVQEKENETPHIKTEIAKFVILESTDSSFSWQLDIENYWEFELFAALVHKVNRTHISIIYGARIPAVNDNRFKASVIVQVFNPVGYDHHVSRMDVVFEAKAADRSWYTTASSKLIDLTGQNKKFYPDSSLKLRIVNVEVGIKNIIWPYHFSMCHFKYYQARNELEWNTFPFYIHDYKFMIYIHASGYNSSEALTLTVYRMVGEMDDMIPEVMKSRTITVQIKKKDGNYARKRLAITGKAREIVEDAIEVDFGKNIRFPLFGYRSKYGVPLSIPHSELDDYISDDCFIFDIKFFLANT